MIDSYEDIMKFEKFNSQLFKSIPNCPQGIVNTSWHAQGARTSWSTPHPTGEHKLLHNPRVSCYKEIIFLSLANMAVQLLCNDSEVQKYYNTAQDLGQKVFSA